MWLYSIHQSLFNNSDLKLTVLTMNSSLHSEPSHDRLVMNGHFSHARLTYVRLSLIHLDWDQGWNILPPHCCSWWVCASDVILPHCWPCSASLRWCWSVSRRRWWRCCSSDCVCGKDSRYQFFGHLRNHRGINRVIDRCQVLTQSSTASFCGWQSCWQWGPSCKRHSENMLCASSEKSLKKSH